MRRKWFQLNNQGSTLLTVIICMAFIAILGSMMLSVTLTNLQMKIIESKSKKNFYTCEMAMEEIRTGIEEIASDQIKEVYEKEVMTDFAGYLAKNKEERNSYVKKKVAYYIIKTIGDDTGYSEADLTNGTAVKVANLSIFTDYLSQAPVGVTRTVTVGISNTDTPIYSETGASVVIQNIRVSLTKEDYETSITSDIVITLPEFTFDDGAETIVYRMDPPFKDYALVADGSIISDQSYVYDTVNTVKGNVYAGAGITVDSNNNEKHVLNINAGHIVTRGNITAVDTGKIVIRGMDSKPPILWADNLMTNTTSSYTTEGFHRATTLDISGICFIKDDLVLEGTNSAAKIAGAYVGFTGVHNAEGSSMMINGAGSSLDLSGLDSLILAGRAHVSVKDALKNTEIMTGESVAFKSNQKAYLIPGKFIKDIYHNPITVADTANDPQVDFSTIDPMVDMIYTDYVDASHPYKIASKQTMEGDQATILRYCYLDFLSGKLADEYLDQYMLKNPTALNIMDPFYLGTVQLPPAESEVSCVGNLMSYDGATVSLTKGLSYSAATDAELDGDMNGYLLNRPVYNDIYAAGLPASCKVGMLGEQYSKLSHLLYLNSTRAYQETDAAVGSVVIPGGVTVIRDNYAANPKVNYYESSVVTVLDASVIHPDDTNFIVVNGDVTLNCSFKGVLIASGNITINSTNSPDFHVSGMLVSVGYGSTNPTAGGNITVGNNVSVKGRLVAVKDILLGINDTFEAADEAPLTSVFDNNGEILQKLFRYANVSVNFTIDQPADNVVDLSALISYENWRKN